jgi:serine/threonine protein kinase
MSNRAEDSPAPPGTTSPGPAPALVSGGDLPPGYVVGEYRVGQVLGRGGMGVVYAGLQPVIEKRVAIKVLHADLSADPSLVRRFLDEARAVNRIRHPNIIDIFSFGQLADSRQYFVMEYLEGRTLADRLLAGDLPLADYPPLLSQICDALDAAHSENIVHRDLKPENIWIVEPRRGRPFAKLLDFGIAKLLATGHESTTRTGMVMGTPQYMSPEQCHGRAVDHRTDIYAMGVILYQIWTGKAPFAGETFAELLTKQLTTTAERPSTLAPVPPELDELIMRCLEKDPARRPQSARELGERLAKILADRPAPTALLDPRPAQASATTTLRGSAHGLDRAFVHEHHRRWPWIAVAAAAAVGAALVATTLAGRKSEPVRIEPAPTPVATSGADTVLTRDAGPDVLRMAGTVEGASVDKPAPPPAAPSQVSGTTAKAVKRPARSEPEKTQRTRAAGSGLVTDNPFR